MRSLRPVITLQACLLVGAAAIAKQASLSVSVAGEAVSAGAAAEALPSLQLQQLQVAELLEPALRAAAAAAHGTVEQLMHATAAEGKVHEHLHQVREHSHARRAPGPLPAHIVGQLGVRYSGEQGPDKQWFIENMQPVGFNSTGPTEPSGSQIWDPNVTWSAITRWHPSGLISNVHGGAVMWTDVGFMSLDVLLLMSMVCYPAFLIAGVMFLTILVSICLVRKDGPGSSGQAAGMPRPSELATHGSSLPPVPVLPLAQMSELSEFSQKLYRFWRGFCCFIPAMFVFGLPALLVALSSPFPQEVFAMLTFVTSVLMTSNGLYMVIFAGSSVWRMRQSMQADYGRMLTDSRSSSDQQSPYAKDADKVRHWVLLPQYKEETEVVAMALESISKSGIAKEQISILLAMEEREQDSHEKAEMLRQQFVGKFAEVIATFHPPNLPNDPPGKASNLAWAFKHLVKHLDGKINYNTEHVILTVSDADSEFHCGYYEGLSHFYLEANEHKRCTTIWQSPVFHVKNYHRQPMPVIVGTMFTSMQEMACLSDPNAIRFPYSTYSLSMHLARRVGGWDAEWIAEDWHMGIKCFLMTLGECGVEPLLLPTANYTPEDSTYLKTVNARWAQAKRHALGFSDMAYFFQMIPLIFCHAVNDASFDRNSLHKFWSMIVYGLAMIIKLTNVHVIIGVISTYGAICLGLKFLMEVLMSPERHVDVLMDETHFCANLLWASSIGCSLIITLMFQGTYELMKPRMEGIAFDWRIVHWAKTVTAFAVFGPVYFIALGLAIWKAAVTMMFQTTFEYEVAAKPTAANRMES
mmetsp:Transcript_49121/g.126688  ORF Transcript_49121/g.126688 Transcript_49121/m.126688 type:complete len:807 (-) Transcript_49121:101-2521(-)